MLAMKSIWTAGLAGMITLGSATWARAQQPPPAVDGGKRIIELPVKNIIATGATTPAQPASTAAQLEAKPASTAAQLEAIRKALEARVLDVRKSEIEIPTKKVIAAAARPDAPKKAIETPVKNVVGDILNKHGFSAPAAPGANAPGSPNANPENPKVEPGKVRWHASFADARAAAARSGKPVLLFQMLGKLDDQFC